MSDVTYQRAHDLLRYESETGLLFWRVQRGPRKAGAVAGCKDTTEGYVLVGLDGELHKAHRLIWFMVKGIWPYEIDHRDGNGFNNTWLNLRECTDGGDLQNLHCVRKNNPLGMTGAFWDRRDNRWFSHIYVDRQKIYLGTFPSAQAAHVAYVAAKKIHHKFCGEMRGGCTESS